MKKKFSYPFIFVSLFLCVSFLFPCFASAAIDYNDYISNLKVDGDNDLVTVTFPGSFSNWSVSQNGIEIYNGISESFAGLPIDGLSGLQVFSNVFYGTGRLDVTNIPDGTSISGSYNVRINWATPTTSPFSYRTSFVVHYLSSSGYVGSVVIDDSTYDDTPPGTIGYGFTIPYSFVMDKPDSALTAYFEFQIHFLSNTNAASSLTASMSPMTMQMSISSLYRLQQQTGKTNQLLEQVEQQLDNAIHGSPDSVTPNGGNIVGDVDDLEDQLFDSVSGGLDAADSIFASSSSFLYSLAPAFVFVSSMCNDLWSFGPFGNLLQVSLGLGVGAAILGLGFSALRSRSESRFHGFTKAKKKGE